MSQPSDDPFAKLKSMQREAWALFSPLEAVTTVPAARLVAFARVRTGEAALDVGCGTGVVAVTAARAGARVRALDLSPVLLERARHNASVAGVSIDFVEGDAEALPYPDASFDVVLSQFGHMFAPRPEVVTRELLRVTKPGGRIAFATWPPELYTGRMFALVARYLPPPPPGAPAPAPPPTWGNPGVVSQRLGDAVTEVLFERDTMIVPTLSPQHARVMLEATLGPVTHVTSLLKDDAARLAEFRSELEALIGEIFVDNHMRQHYLMTRATKR